MSQTPAERFAKAQAIYLKEQEQQFIATDINDLPISYELISDEWLTKALCAKVPGARVLSHTLDVPDEGTTSRRRIFLTYNEVGNKAGLPASVFCKASHSMETRFMNGLNRLIEGESVFYNQLRPMLDIEAPVGLFANVNSESMNSILIMEDMAGGVEFCNHKTPISLARAKSQMELLARFHGAYYSPSEKRQLIESYQPMHKWADLTEQTISWSDARVRGFEAGVTVIPVRLFERADEIEPATMKAFASHDSLPVTLLHNDVHLKNWYVAANGKMGISDWGSCVKGCGVRDLVYCISTSLAVDDRRQWEVELIHHYLDCLEAEGGSPLTFDQTFLVYRQQLFLALAMWTATLTPSPGSPDMQPAETSLEFIKRMTHAIDDLDALDSFS